MKPTLLPWNIRQEEGLRFLVQGKAKFLKMYSHVVNPQFATIERQERAQVVVKGR